MKVFFFLSSVVALHICKAKIHWANFPKSHLQIFQIKFYLIDLFFSSLPVSLLAPDNIASGSVPSKYVIGHDSSLKKFSKFYEQRLHFFMVGPSFFQWLHKNVCGVRSRFVHIGTSFPRTSFFFRPLHIKKEYNQISSKNFSSDV